MRRGNGEDATDGISGLDLTGSVEPVFCGTIADDYFEEKRRA